VWCSSFKIVGFVDNFAKIMKISVFDIFYYLKS